MAKIKNQIQSADEVICKTINSLDEQRDLLSQIVLSQLRNLVEGIVVFIHEGSMDGEFQYEKVRSAVAFVNGKPKLKFLARFHQLIQKSASHYTMDGDASERLMLKYYEYLYRTRSLLKINGYTDLMVDGAPSPHQSDTTLRWLIDRLRS